jgi:hypothetical protein
MAVQAVDCPISDLDIGRLAFEPLDKVTVLIVSNQSSMEGQRRL